MNQEHFPKNEYDPNREAAENVPEALAFQPEGAAEEIASDIITNLLEQTPKYHQLDKRKQIETVKRYVESTKGMVQNKMPEEDIRSEMQRSMEREGFTAESLDLE